MQNTKLPDFQLHDNVFDPYKLQGTFMHVDL